MAETISIDELISSCENVYEAIVVMAKRARQINEEQKQLVDAQNEMDDHESDFDEEIIRREVFDRKYVKMPKPTSIALQEMMQGKLKFFYAHDDSER